MKVKLLIVLFLLCFASVFGAEIVQIANPQTQQQLNNQTQIEIIQRLDSLNAKISEVPSMNEINSSFLQLDQRIQATGNNQFYLIAVVVVLNDLLLISGFLLLKSKGLI